MAQISNNLSSEAGPKAVNPVLSPDGNELLYTQEINGRQQIFKLDINNDIQRQLTHVGHLYQANASTDWFDPAYALPSCTTTPTTNNSMGRTKTGIGFRFNHLENTLAVMLFKILELLRLYLFSSISKGKASLPERMNSSWKWVSQPTLGSQSCWHRSTGRKEEKLR